MIIKERRLNKKALEVSIKNHTKDLKAAEASIKYLTSLPNMSMSSIERQVIVRGQNRVILRDLRALKKKLYPTLKKA